MTTSIAWQAQGDIQGASLDPAGTVKYAITSAADAAHEAPRPGGDDTLLLRFGACAQSLVDQVA